MCWINSKTPIKQIAEKDIICYKTFRVKDIIYKQRSFLGFNYEKIKIQALFSIIKGFKYIPYRKQKYINISVEHEYYDFFTIDKGYHSYETLNRAKLEKDRYKHILYISNIVIVECIIPKDTEYYINSEQEIVTSTRKVTDKVMC